MLESTPANELTTSLFRIATDPVQTESLHKLLGAFCHQCRNVLNSMKLSLYLAKREHPPASPNFWSEFEPGYLAVEQFYDRLQAICRPMALTPIKASLELLIDDRRNAWVSAMGERQRSLAIVAPPEPAIGQFDPVRLGEGLDVFIHWRARVGPSNTPAELSWSCADGRFLLEWIEQGGGPTISSESQDGGPAVLSLPFLARVISAHGGTLDLNFTQGLHLRIQWPVDLPHR